MRRFHLALGVPNISASVADYTHRLGSPPNLVIPGEYALWRTDTLNLSLRRLSDGAAQLRHLGWEDSEAPSFSAEVDVNGVTWEHFSAEQQDAEIAATWPARG